MQYLVTQSNHAPIHDGNAEWIWVNIEYHKDIDVFDLEISMSIYRTGNSSPLSKPGNMKMRGRVSYKWSSIQKINTVLQKQHLLICDVLQW